MNTNNADMNNADHPARVGLLAPMPSEFKPLAKALSLQRGDAGWSGTAGTIQLIAAKTGMGTRLAAEATARLLDRGPLDHVTVSYTHLTLPTNREV